MIIVRVGVGGHVESYALNNCKLKIFKLIDERVLVYSNNLDLLPPKKGKRKVQGVPQSQTAALRVKLNKPKLNKPKLSFRYLKQGIQEFHRKYVLAPADKAADNVVVV